MATHRMTPARRAALKKAQMASARKRRGHGKGKLAAANRRATRNRNIALAAGGLAGAAALAGYHGGYQRGLAKKPPLRFSVSKPKSYLRYQENKSTARAHKFLGNL